MTTNRDSSIELLRLVLMLFIIIHHFFVHGIGYLEMSHDEVLDLDKTYLLINSFVIIAVDCFVFISGYYGIKCGARGVVRLYLICTFYNLLSHLMAIYITGEGQNLFHCFLPFSHSNGLWFIPVYFFLYILSPVLNCFLHNCSLVCQKYTIVVLALLVCYFGYFWDAQISLYGYDLLNFILIYVIGRFFKEHEFKPLKEESVCIAGYILCVLMIWGLSFYQESPMSHVVYLSAFKYNNPIVIAAAIFFFHIFNNLRFHSKTVNWFSSSSLVIYLLHDNYNNRHFYLEWSRNIYHQCSSTFLVFCHFIILAILIMLFCLLVDKVRILLFGDLEKWIIKQADALWTTITNRIIQ